MHKKGFILTTIVFLILAMEFVHLESFARIITSNPEEDVTVCGFIYQGTPYKAGGNTPTGFDASGFVQYAFKEGAKINLPRTTTDQFKTGTPVSKDNLLEADLVFFKVNGKIQTVGIYEGNNSFYTVTTKKGVTLQSLSNPYWKKHYFAAKRIINPSCATVEKIKKVYALARKGQILGCEFGIGSTKEEVVKKWGSPTSNHQNPNYPNFSLIIYEKRLISFIVKDNTICTIAHHINYLKDAEYNYYDDLREMNFKKIIPGIHSSKKLGGLLHTGKNLMLIGDVYAVGTPEVADILFGQ